MCHCVIVISECRKKDEEVAKKGGKGKGINSWKYSARKGNTYSWSPWWQGEHPGKGWNQKGGHSWTSGKSSGNGSDCKGGKGGKGSKGMYWFDTVPENEWDWNGGSSTSSAMFNFEASKLTGPPGLPLRNRFQELLSDDESEGETHLQQHVLCCSPTTTHNEFGITHHRAHCASRGHVESLSENLDQKLNEDAVKRNQTKDFQKVGKLSATQRRMKSWKPDAWERSCTAQLCNFRRRQ